jgi:hypothetical protein
MNLVLAPPLKGTTGAILPREIATVGQRQKFLNTFTHCCTVRERELLDAAPTPKDRSILSSVSRGNLNSKISSVRSRVSISDRDTSTTHTLSSTESPESDE